MANKPRVRAEASDDTEDQTDQTENQQASGEDAGGDPKPARPKGPTTTRVGRAPPPDEDDDETEEESTLEGHTEEVVATTLSRPDRTDEDREDDLDKGEDWHFPKDANIQHGGIMHRFKAGVRRVPASLLYTGFDPKNPDKKQEYKPHWYLRHNKCKKVKVR